MKSHQQKQRDVIASIEKQLHANTANFSMVEPVQDYENDARICLTSAHLPSNRLIKKIQEEVITPLKRIDPTQYFYADDSLHMTIKNIRVISDPPNFDTTVVEKAEKVFSKVIPSHKQFQVSFYRLFLFPNNLALFGTTDPELDDLILDLDKNLKKEGIPDDKQYINSRYFFSNITLARFTHPPTQEFIEKVRELSQHILFSPYIVDSVTLLTSNGSLRNRHIIKTWRLQEK